MPNRRFARLLACACLLGGLPACASFDGLFVRQSHSAGLDRVDVLLDGIEALHVDSVLCQERSADALAALTGLVEPDFRSDPLAAYTRFVDAADRAEEQEDLLLEGLGPLRRSADAVFDAWRADLQRFVDPTLREHSEGRLEQTRARFDAILQALEPARTELAAFNGSLRDMALYLGHDFNAGAVVGVERELDGLRARADDVHAAFDAVRQAAQAYVQASALPGETDLARLESEQVRLALRDEQRAAEARDEPVDGPDAAAPPGFVDEPAPPDVPAPQGMEPAIPE